MSKIKQRDWSVELMRIIACVIVIGCHTVPQPISVNGGDCPKTSIVSSF